MWLVVEMNAKTVRRYFSTKRCFSPGARQLKKNGGGGNKQIVSFKAHHTGVHKLVFPFPHCSVLF